MGSSSSVVVHSPDIHEHHGPQAEDWMDDQLQDASAPVGMVTGFGGPDWLQHQVVTIVTVPQRHVAQNLQSEQSCIHEWRAAAVCPRSDTHSHCA